MDYIFYMSALCSFENDNNATEIAIEGEGGNGFIHNLIERFKKIIGRIGEVLRKALRSLQQKLNIGKGAEDNEAGKQICKEFSDISIEMASIHISIIMDMNKLTSFTAKGDVGRIGSIFIQGIDDSIMETVEKIKAIKDRIEALSEKLKDKDSYHVQLGDAAEAYLKTAQKNFSAISAKNRELEANCDKIQRHLDGMNDTEANNLAKTVLAKIITVLTSFGVLCTNATALLLQV